MSVNRINKETYNLNAEQKLLGIMILKPDVIKQVTQIISVDNFYLATHKYIFNSIRTIVSNKQKTSKTTLMAILKKENRLFDIGGEKYISNLLTVMATSENAKYYAQIVKIQSLSYKLLNLACELGNNQYTSPALAKIVSNITNEISIQNEHIDTTNLYLKITNLVKGIFSYLDQCPDRQFIMSKAS